MTVANFLQVLLFRGKLIFSRFSDKDSMKHLSDLHLWHLFKYVELTEVVRKNEELFNETLNKVRVGNIDDDVEKLLKIRFIRECEEKPEKLSKSHLAHVSRDWICYEKELDL